MHVTHYTPHTTRYTPLTAHHSLHTTHSTPHTTHHSLHTTHYTPHTTHCTLYIAQYTQYSGEQPQHTPHTHTHLKIRDLRRNHKVVGLKITHTFIHTPQIHHIHSHTLQNQESTEETQRYATPNLSLTHTHPTHHTHTPQSQKSVEEIQCNRATNHSHTHTHSLTHTPHTPHTHTHSPQSL